MTDVRPGFFGPALGRHPGWVTTQGEVLAGLFREGGLEVRVSSDHVSPIARGAAHARDLLRWRKEIDVAVVSAFSGRAFALARESITIAGRLRIPTVLWLHGGNLPAWATGRSSSTGRVLRAADAVVAPTPFLARWADGYVGIRSTVIPNVVDLSSCPYRERRQISPRLLWMRTFQDLYDPATAVRTLAVLRDRGLDATLTMAGQDKGLLDPTKQLARDLGVSEHLSFPGFASGPSKAALFEAHDVFLNTNLIDNAPVTVIEAAASGLVVVSSDAGGLPDLITNGTNGRLVPPGDPLAMADEVARLIIDQREARRLAAGGRALALRSDWPGVRRAWLETWERITVDRSRRG